MTCSDSLYVWIVTKTFRLRMDPSDNDDDDNDFNDDDDDDDNEYDDDDEYDDDEAHQMRMMSQLGANT